MWLILIETIRAFQVTTLKVTNLISIKDQFTIFTVWFTEKPFSKCGFLQS